MRENVGAAGKGHGQGWTSGMPFPYQGITLVMLDLGASNNTSSVLPEKVIRGYKMGKAMGPGPVGVTKAKRFFLKK